MNYFKNERLDRDKYKGVEGWLLLLCFALVIGSPLRTLYNFYKGYTGVYQYFDQFPGLLYILIIDSIISIGLMTLSIRAGIALFKIKEGAVKIAKKYFLIFLAYSIGIMILPLISGLPKKSIDAMLDELTVNLIQSLFYSGIWYWYLSVSKRVERTYISYANNVVTEEIIQDSLESDTIDETETN